MEIKEGATAESFRYVQLAPRPVRPLIEETAQAVEQVQDIKTSRHQSGAKRALRRALPQRAARART